MSDRPLYPSYTILLVDDEASMLTIGAFTLRKANITNIETIQDSREVMARIARGDCGIVILDMDMPHINGRELLRSITAEYPDISVYMLTGRNDVETAVDCMKLGALDYILKPFHPGKFVETVLQAMEARMRTSERSALKNGILDSALKAPEAFAPIITNNAQMRGLFKYAEVIAGTDLPVLITGETGTGKELMAQAIHQASGKSGKYVSVNIAGIDDAVLSDTLFGHVRGAFTGAEKARNGLIEEAAGGTLFLDEIGDMKPESQTKLLRLLQERTYHPVGSDTPLVSAARIVAATNRDLKSMSQSGAFRYDLYYRLQAHEVHLPALRERKDDLPLLADAFLDEGCRIFGKRRIAAGRELITLLGTYHWPGNIRQLQGLLIDAVSRSTTPSLSLAHLKEKLRDLRLESGVLEADPLTAPAPDAQSPAGPASSGMTFPLSLPSVAQWELLLMQEALRRTGGNKSQAADLLGIARTTLIKRLKEAEPSSAG
ncbi:MAG: sigma-54-dependent transcriptional regulator [Acidobacteriota bacterium]